MLKNEVGNDGAAPAMESQTRNENLINEFSSALSDSTALKVAAGTAALAAGTIATVAAIKYLKPAMEVGKAVGAVADDGAFAGVRTAAKTVDLTKLPTGPRDSAAFTRIQAAAKGDLSKVANTNPSETGALAAENGGSLLTSTDQLAELGIPISAATRDAAAKSLSLSTEALVKNGIPINASTRAAAAAERMTPATDAILKNSIPISKSTRTADGVTDFDPNVVREGLKGVGIDAADVLKGYPNAYGNVFSNGIARIDDASILAHEVAHRSGNSSPSVAYLQQLKDIRAMDFGGGLFKNGKPMTERLGFKEVDPKLPMFPTMDDLVKLMPESGPNMSKVVMNLDGAPRAVSVSDAITILGERSALHIQSNPTAAAKALAERMPKPAPESDVTALAAKMAPRLDTATVNEAIAKTTKGV
jgi:hypothetical protein